MLAVNCAVGLCNSDMSDIIGQVISGSVIFVVALALILYSIKTVGGNVR